MDHWRRKRVTTGAGGSSWDQIFRRTVFDDDDTNERRVKDSFMPPGADEKEYSYDISTISDKGDPKNIRTIFSYRPRTADACQTYSPVRSMEAVCEEGMKTVFSLDLTAKREDGELWDFSRRKHRREAAALVVQDEPHVIIANHLCAMHSIFQNGTNLCCTKKELKAKLRQEAVHMKFCIGLYEFQ